MRAMEKNGKKLGVLGGMGSAASAEFLRLLAAMAPATNDQEHPIVYMLADSEIPDRTEGILGTGPDPSARIYKDLGQLTTMGADILAVPCNTAHYFIDRFTDPLPLPLVHIVDETVKAAQRMEPQGVWMISTIGTWKTGIYQDYAAKYNLPLYFPEDAERKLLHQCILEVKANQMLRAGEHIRQVVEKLWSVKVLPIMTACTELPLGYDASGLPQEKAVSSLGALADACIRELYEEK